MDSFEWKTCNFFEFILHFCFVDQIMSKRKKARRNNISSEMTQHAVINWKETNVRILIECMNILIISHGAQLLYLLWYKVKNTPYRRFSFVLLLNNIIMFFSFLPYSRSARTFVSDHHLM